MKCIIYICIRLRACLALQFHRHQVRFQTKSQKKDYFMIASLKSFENAQIIMQTAVFPNA